MYRYLLFVLAAFFLAACGSSKINVVYPDYTKYKSNDFDLRVMKAYNYEYIRFYTLFNEIKKSIKIIIRNKI